MTLPLMLFKKKSCIPSQKEFWHISQSRETGTQKLEFDEEIYIKGNSVVWSRGCESQARLVQKSYELDSAILEVR